MEVRRTAWVTARFVLRITSLAVVVALVGGLTAAVGVAVAPHGGSLITAVEGDRQAEVLPLEQGAERSKMYDAYGGLMAILRDAEDREWIALDRMPVEVIDGVLAVEDFEFYEHNGVDWLATVRAASENVAAGAITQGGSTLTQQLVKLQFVGSEQSLERKIREAMLARDLEEQYSKDEILEFYLNTIYFGNSAYGVQAAAEIYFGKNVEDLDFGDMALLSGLIRSPGVYTFNDPDIDFARLRRSRSLERYLGLDLVTEAEAAEFEQRPIPTFSRSPQEEELELDYFAEEVKRRLLEMSELGETREARRQVVFQGGLRIYTTFDPVLDRYAQEAVDEVFPDRSVLDPFTVSLASVDPTTGAVRAMLGGTDFTEEQFNLATQGRRQPGSSFKTYVLATAFEQGYGPSDTISGIGPCVFDDGTPELYRVQNFGNSSGRIGSLRTMTTSSSNCAFVRLGLLVGLDEVVATTNDMVGLDEGRLLPFPSMSLGAQELTPLEQAIGYSVLANDGLRMEPFLITRIEDRNGQVLFEHAPTGRQVITESTARAVTSVLASNVTGGTGGEARLASGQPSAGKTGTADNFEDAWFGGYTPQLSTAVWMGHPEEKVQMRNVGGRSVTGGSYPAMVWEAFMRRALEGEPIVEFESGPGIGRNRFLFLPDEQCRVPLLVGEEVVEFTIACSLVDVVDGEFAFGETAVCEDQEIPLPDGSTEIRDVPCSELERLLNPTTTTSTTTTSTTAPPGSPSTTTTAPPDSSTTTTSTTTTSTTAPPGSPSTTTTAPPDSSTTTTAPPAADDSGDATDAAGAATPTG